MFEIADGDVGDDRFIAGLDPFVGDHDGLGVGVDRPAGQFLAGCRVDGGHVAVRVAEHYVQASGALQVDESLEFIHRAKVLKPIEIIRQATTIGAEILRMEGKLGTVAPGALADLIVVDGNPVKNLKLFLDQGAHLPAIMKGGKFHKNALK